MTLEDGMHPVSVPVGECRCIGTPHAQGDEVFLKPELDVPMAMAAHAAMNMESLTKRVRSGELSMTQANAETQYALTSVYLRFAITGWTFVDAKGNPEPITQANITRLLPWGKGGAEVAERADTLYSEPLFAPLVEASEAATKLLEKEAAEAAQRLNRQQRRQMKKSSPNGQTEKSISVTRHSGNMPQALSPRSLPPSSAGRPSEVPVP
jgi:hypothetical protein